MIANGDTDTIPFFVGPASAGEGFDEDFRLVTCFHLMWTHCGEASGGLSIFDEVGSSRSLLWI